MRKVNTITKNPKPTTKREQQIIKIKELDNSHESGKTKQPNINY